jgi:putative peptidoglycan lipid II flippase
MNTSWRPLVPVNVLVFAAVLFGFANNMLIAAYFGLTYRVDSFFAAMVLPNLFMFLCIDYLGKNFLPVLAIAKRESDASASQMTSAIVTVVAVLAVAVAILLTLFSDFLFDLLLPGFDEDKADRVTQYFLIMAPAIVLMAINSFHEYVCQYDSQYVQVVAVRMLLPVANVSAILLLGPRIGELSLPWGYLAGHVAVFICMARLANYRYVPTLRIRDRLERRVFANSAIVMSTGIIARTKSIVLNYLASSLGSGAISALALATKLTEPLERCSFSGAHMMFVSRTAHLLAANDRVTVGRLYGTGLRVSFLLLAPLLWWIGMNSEPIVGLMFARGEFTAEMTVLVAATLTGLLPSVVFIGVNRLMLNAFYAMNRVTIPALVMPCAMLVYVACAVPLADSLGTQGLAIATSLTSICVFGTLISFLSRELANFPVFRTVGRLAAYAGSSGVVMLGVAALLTETGLSSAGAAVVSLPLGTLIYGGMLWLVRDGTLLRLLKYLREWRLAPEVPA